MVKPELEIILVSKYNKNMEDPNLNKPQTEVEYPFTERQLAFRESDIYKEHIIPLEDFQGDALERMIIATKCFVDLPRFNNGSICILNREGAMYNPKFAEPLFAELRKIRETKELELFFSQLISKLEVLYKEREEGKFDDGVVDFNFFLGNLGLWPLMTTIDEFFIGPYMKYKGGKIETTKDLDWWYTLMKFGYMTRMIAVPVSEIYKANIDDPRSIELKEFLDSKGEGDFLM